MNGNKLTSVVVDSGGSFSAWAFIFADGATEIIEVESFHPTNFSDEFFKRNKLFLKEHITSPIPLFFFGAGMGKQENKEILSDFFQPYFSSMTILTDIQGLVLSLKMTDGAIAIMGTGSVLVDIADRTIRQQIGGLGHLKGDEGSAYYFGKLVLTDFFDGRLSTKQTVEIERSAAISVGREALLLDKYTTASFAKNLDKQLFLDYHKKNIKLFFQVHFDHHIQVKEATFVGSYAFFMKDLILNELQQRNIQLSECIQKPIGLFCAKFGIR